jgi:FKBP-type peptidyl-prolyl cis-trans isomerase FklB
MKVFELSSQPVFLRHNKKFMKRIILTGCLLIVVHAIQAQGGKPVVKPVPKPAPLLKTTNDSLSYVMGEVLAFAIIQQNPALSEIKPTNANAFMKAYNDIIGKKPTLLDDVTANALINNYMTKVMEGKAKAQIDSGKAFLATNKLRKEVKVTASGLQYEVITEGNGIKPTVVDTFVCNYRGTTLNGNEFDASANRGEPLKMALNQVIPGWTEGLQLMSVGSKFKLWIPYNIGYGVMGNGPKIPGGALLVFEMELLDVKKKQ